MKLLLIALSVGCIASPAAKAQLLHLVELQRPPSCIEKDDGYSAGMQEKFPIKSKQGEEQASCATIPAGYLSTAGHDGHDGRGGIVEMLGSSFRMGGSRVTPSAVILVQHDEHPQDRSLHDLFYSKWHMPNRGNRRAFSCCNKEDCYPTPIKLMDGRYWVLRREDGKWLPVPNDRLEQLQTDPVESPDHQSHACIAKPALGDHVFCATLGEGI